MRCATALGDLADLSVTKVFMSRIPSISKNLAPWRLQRKVGRTLKVTLYTLWIASTPAVKKTTTRCLLHACTRGRRAEEYADHENEVQVGIVKAKLHALVSDKLVVNSIWHGVLFRMWRCSAAIFYTVTWWKHLSVS